MKTLTYKLAGLRVVSDFPLSGLEICRSSAEVHDEVVFRRARIPQELVSATATFREGGYSGEYDGREILIDIPEAGRFLVRAGKEILVDPAPASDDGEVRTYLLGTAFGLLCYQRGITPLHASAIEVEDGCVAFVGESGAGKSTLVAALAQRGHQVIADDVCFQHLDDKGNVQSWPGIGRIRLWEEAMTALGCNGPGVEREMRGYRKYYVPVRTPRNPIGCRRLRRVYELHSAPDGVTRVARLQGASAVEVLMQNIYRLGLAERLGYKPQAFVVCTALVRRVPVFRFSRPLGFDALNQNVNFLERHLLVSC